MEPNGNNGNAVIDSPFKLEVVNDDYEAYVTVNEPSPDDEFGSGDLVRLLEKEHIVYGIKEDAIERIFQEQRYGERILIAEGTRPKDGKDTEIQYNFETEVKPKIDEHGNINYKELNLVQMVKEGDELVKITPAEEGTPGCDVYGKKIPAKDGESIDLPKPGKNVCPSKENHYILLSRTGGYVKLNNGNVDVDNVYVVYGDVNFKTGNITYDGPVYVKGNVPPGFNITAKGDIQIDGLIGDNCHVESGSDIVLKGGFVGEGNGEIIAWGNVIAKFCYNKRITAGGDVTIDRYIMHSIIHAGGKLTVTSVQDIEGCIVGGESYALKGIEAKVFGSKIGTNTILSAGADKDTRKKIGENKKLLEGYKKRKEGIEADLAKFPIGELTGKKKELYDTLTKQKEELGKESERLTAENETLKTNLKELENVVIKVNGVAYPTTTIRIFDERISVDDPAENEHVCYKYGPEGLITLRL